MEALRAVVMDESHGHEPNMGFSRQGTFLIAHPGGGTPTVRDVAVGLGDDCFVEAIRRQSSSLYYNTSRIGRSKQISENDIPDTTWCAPFPTLGD